MSIEMADGTLPPAPAAPLAQFSPVPRCVYARPVATRAIDRLPSNLGRSSAVHALIESFDLLTRSSHQPDHDQNRARVIRTELASRSELEAFHDPEYVGESYPTRRSR